MNITGIETLRKQVGVNPTPYAVCAMEEHFDHFCALRLLASAPQKPLFTNTKNAYEPELLEAQTVLFRIGMISKRVLKFDGVGSGDELLILLIANQQVQISVIDETPNLSVVNYLNKNFKDRIHIFYKIPEDLEPYDATVGDYRKKYVEKLLPGTFVYAGPPHHKYLKDFHNTMLTYRV